MSDRDEGLSPPSGVNRRRRKMPSLDVAGRQQEAILSPMAELEAIYRIHAGRLWRALLGFTGDPEVASDAMAEAFAQALGRLEAIRTPVPWVWRAAFRIAAGEMKQRGQRSTMEEEAYEMPDPARELIEALRVLSPKQRGAVVLHHYAGYSVREAAAILGSTASAVKVHLHRGRRRLRELLEESYG